MKRTILVFVLIILTATSFSQARSGYHISVAISGLQDSAVYLAYHYGDKQYIKDTVKVDKKGYGIFAGQELLPQGIYMIVLPGKKYFEILISDDQQFAVSCSYRDYFNTLKFAGSDENSSFLVYQRNWSAMQQEDTHSETKAAGGEHEVLPEECH
jgi:hypothetical protein